MVFRKLAAIGPLILAALFPRPAAAGFVVRTLGPDIASPTLPKFSETAQTTPRGDSSLLATISPDGDAFNLPKPGPMLVTRDPRGLDRTDFLRRISEELNVWPNRFHFPLIHQIAEEMTPFHPIAIFPVRLGCVVLWPTDAEPKFTAALVPTLNRDPLLYTSAAEIARRLTGRAGPVEPVMATFNSVVASLLEPASAPPSRELAASSDMRRAKPRDFAEIQSLVWRTRAREFLTFSHPKTFWSMIDAHDHSSAGPHPRALTIAVRDGEKNLIATGSLLPSEMDRRIAELKTVYVLHELRRMRIGARLVARLLYQARRLLYRRVILSTRNPEAALFFKQFGFQIIPAGPEEDVRMELHF